MQDYRRSRQTLCQIARARNGPAPGRGPPQDPGGCRSSGAGASPSTTTSDRFSTPNCSLTGRAHNGPATSSSSRRDRKRIRIGFGTGSWRHTRASSGRRSPRVCGRITSRFETPAWSATFPRGARGREPSPESSFRCRFPTRTALFRRVDEYLLDAELTDKILQARQLRQQNGGKWPAAIPGIETTRYPGARWIYTVSPAGS